MTDAGDLERVEKLFQETIALEKQFKSLLERQTPLCRGRHKSSSNVRNYHLTSP